MSKSPEDKGFEQAKRIAGTLVRQPPKPHEEMKLGKPRAKRTLGKVGPKSSKVKEKPGR